jgi:hypothetical protein
MTPFPTPPDPPAERSARCIKCHDKGFTTVKMNLEGREERVRCSCQPVVNYDDIQGCIQAVHELLEHRPYEIPEPGRAQGTPDYRYAARILEAAGHDEMRMAIAQLRSDNRIWQDLAAQLRRRIKALEEQPPTPRTIDRGEWERAIMGGKWDELYHTDTLFHAIWQIGYQHAAQEQGGE